MHVKSFAKACSGILSHEFASLILIAQPKAQHSNDHRSYGNYTVLIWRPLGTNLILQHLVAGLKLPGVPIPKTTYLVANLSEAPSS